jgi:hypothetical protein
MRALGHRLWPIFFPFRLWPLRYQVGLVITLVLLLSGSCGFALYQSHRTLAVARAELVSLESEIKLLNAQQQSAAALAKASAKEAPALPPAGRIDDVVRDMTLLAQRYGVAIPSVSIESSRSSSQSLAQRQINVRAKGSYAGLKAWTGDLLHRHPWLLVRNLDWRATETMGQATGFTLANQLGAAEANIEAQMSWVLYVQG